jgi:hypothetical protein
MKFGSLKVGQMEADLLAYLKKRSTITSNGCWLWLGAVTSAGYGAFNFNKIRMDVHRVSYTLHKGPIPIGKFVCHTCDTRNCWNPDHLFTACNRENVADRFRKHGAKGWGGWHGGGKIIGNRKNGS